MKEQQKQIDELKREVKELKDGSSKSGEISLGGIYFEFDQNDYTSFETVTDAQGNPQIEDFDEDGVSLSNLSQGIGFEGGLNTA